MTTVQWVGSLFFVVLFFGSIGLGRYLRYRDKKTDVVEVRVLTNTPRLISDDLDNIMYYYRDELVSILWNYYLLAVIHGEAYAEEWKKAEFVKLYDEVSKKLESLTTP